MIADVEITSDNFLDGELFIRQPKIGYRAGIDAVLLGYAASVIKANNLVELGCGVGTALLICANQRQKHNPVCNAVGLEIDTNAAVLCSQNITANGFDKTVSLQNIDCMKPNSALENKFDLAFSNPPFFDDDKAIRGPSIEREAAYIIGAPLLNWLKAMLRLVKSNGEILLIHRADRLFDILSALQNRAGDIKILPIHAVEGRPANRIIIRAKKGSKAPTQILPGVCLRKAATDSEYVAEIARICKGGETSLFDGLIS
jgi:tRNA1(Val) A37 N6-methylase TrmN6